MTRKNASQGRERVLIVGAGNMGGALAKGLTEHFDVSVHDVHAERLASLAASAGASALPSLAGKGALAIDAIVLCVKPQDLATVSQDLKGRLGLDTVVISILAGVTLADVGSALAFAGGVVRAMPNIAALCHTAATAMCCNEVASDLQKKLAERIFGAIGEADWTKESLLDAVTGLSGSGPAYFYMIIEALTDGGVKMGIPRVLAHKLATQTALGAATLVKTTGLHPAILRDQVTTPGGTTINAIHELEDRGLRAMLISAVETATKRAADLRKK